MELQDTALTSTTPESRYPDLVLQKGTIDADYQSRQGQVSAVTSPPINSEPTSNGRCRNCNKRTFGPCSCRSRTEEGNLNPGFRDKGHQFDPIRVKVEEVKLNELESMEKGPEIEFGRKWEYFPGKNKFYFNGRLMTAPSIRFCMLSFFLILVTFVLFTIFDGPFLAKELTIAIPIIGFVLFFLVMVNMFKTSCSDPGILPRASAQESEFIEKSYASAHGLRPPPRTKDIVVNGQTIKSKYCFTCKMFRPPRASHCGVCDNCVDRFDHHCPFLGNCIGKRNYRNFYTFIVSLSLLAVFVLSCSITHLALIGKEKGNFLDALRDSPTSAVVILISFFGMWTVIGLAGFHTYLIAVEQTTNEDIKGIFGRSNSVNPYTKGNVCHNCCFILCGPYQPSLIDSRGLVTPDFLASLPRKTGGNEISTSPHCSLPPGSMRAHCGDGPNTPRSGTNEMTGQPNMYQITALESGGTKSGVGTTNVISSTTQFPRASIPGHPVPSLPKAGTVPVESGKMTGHGPKSFLNFQPSINNTHSTSTTVNGYHPAGALSQSQKYLVSSQERFTPEEDMSLSMVQLDYPEYNSPPLLRSSHRRQMGTSTSVPLITNAHQNKSVPAGVLNPNSGSSSSVTANRRTLSTVPVSAVDAPVALAFHEQVLPETFDSLTMINSPLHLDSIS
ncbi:unnamed protein product [Allacma fusca]|uniref:Palmitoyltransferase n=1 Tax=Allacma fusca TaxID=39272 RepID=A0A8J2K4T9_9HEXA|nr:unnamed protein product [Allacma fusca]